MVNLFIFCRALIRNKESFIKGIHSFFDYLPSESFHPRRRIFEGILNLPDQFEGENIANARILSLSSSDKFRIYASVSFILLILVVGLPMWWKTTEVYRMKLPYNEIEALTKVPIRTRSVVYIYTQDHYRSKLLRAELRDIFTGRKDQ